MALAMHPSARRHASSPAHHGLPSASPERRREARLTSEALGLETEAKLGDTIHVRIINVSPRGALVEQPDWIRPGTPTELHLSRRVRGDHPERLVAKGTIVRSWVHRITPLVYRSAVLFDPVRPAAAKATLASASSHDTVTR
jgi:hypothetical protein